MRIFITGISGQLGRILARVLSKNHEVVGLVRRMVEIHGVSEYVQGDLLYPESFVDKIAECDCVIFNAAVYRSSGVETDYYFKINSYSVDRIFQLLAKRKPFKLRKAVYISTNAVHDLSKDRPVNENTPFGPSDFYQYSKLLGEQIFLKWVESLNIQGNIVRPGMIWGDGDQRLKKIFLLATMNPIPIIGNKNPWCHFVTFSDLADCVKRIVENNQVNQEAFLIAGRRAVRLVTIFELISYILGKKPRFCVLPLWPFDVLSDLFEPAYRLLRKDPPIFRRRFAFFTKNRIFDCSKFERHFGKIYSKDLISEINDQCFEYGLIKAPLPRLRVSIDPRNLRSDGSYSFENKQVVYKFNSYTYSNSGPEELLLLSPERKIIESEYKIF